MDFSSLFSPGSWPGSMLPQNQPGAVQGAGGPMNILPPVAQSPQTPVGAINGTQPQQPAAPNNQAGQNFALGQAAKLLAPPDAPPPMAPINMAHPAGMGMLNQLGALPPAPAPGVPPVGANPQQAPRPFGWPPHIPGAF